MRTRADARVVIEWAATTATARVAITLEAADLSPVGQQRLPRSARFFALISLLVLPGSLSGVETIRPEDAADHVGENGTVRGVVGLPHYAAGSKSQPTFLNPAKTYPEQIFTAAIFVAVLLGSILLSGQTAAGVCPNLRELQSMVDCWVTSNPADMPRCSAPWSMEQVRDCMNSAAGTYSKDPALGVAILGAMMPPHRCRVPLRKVNDELSYVVPTIINRNYGPVAIVDTGFTGSLVIPRSIVDDLRARGVLTNGDSSGPPVTSTLADGSEIIQETIIVREVILPGCHAFRNVPITISPTGSVSLPGQGILSRFGSAAIDHKEHSLVLVPERLSH